MSFALKPSGGVYTNLPYQFPQSGSFLLSLHADPIIDLSVLLSCDGGRYHVVVSSPGSGVKLNIYIFLISEIYI
jgi:hypothetical protein